MLKGIVRKIDNFGRVSIPKEYLKSLNIKNGDSVEITQDGNHISVSKVCESYNVILTEKEIEIIREKMDYFLPEEIRKKFYDLG